MVMNMNQSDFEARSVSFELCGVRLYQGAELSEKADRYLSSLGSENPSPHDVLYGFLNWLRKSNNSQ